MRLHKCTAYAVVRHICHEVPFLPQIAQLCQIWSDKGAIRWKDAWQNDKYKCTTFVAMRHICHKVLFPPNMIKNNGITRVGARLGTLFFSSSVYMIICDLTWPSGSGGSVVVGVLVGVAVGVVVGVGVVVEAKVEQWPGLIPSDERWPMWPGLTQSDRGWPLWPILTPYSAKFHPTKPPEQLFFKFSLHFRPYLCF